jgi:hypothetical protein
MKKQNNKKSSLIYCTKNKKYSKIKFFDTKSGIKKTLAEIKRGINVLALHEKKLFFGGEGIKWESYCPLDVLNLDKGKIETIAKINKSANEIYDMAINYPFVFIAGFLIEERNKFRAYSLNMDTKKIKEEAKLDGTANTIAINKNFLFLGGGFTNEDENLVLKSYSLKTNKLRELATMRNTGDFDSINKIVVKGKKIFFAGGRKDRGYLKLFESMGGEETLTKTNGVINDFVFYKNKVLYVGPFEQGGNYYFLNSFDMKTKDIEILGNVNEGEGNINKIVIYDGNKAAFGGYYGQGKKYPIYSFNLNSKNLKKLTEESSEISSIIPTSLTLDEIVYLK